MPRTPALPPRCPACATPLPAEPAMAGAAWYYARHKQKHGPVSWEQLRQLARAGSVQPDDMVLPANGGKWQPASAVTGLFAGAETPAMVATAGTVPETARVVATPLPTVAGYEILGELGRGGMGVVYQARQQGLKRLVALKMILSGAHAGAQELARFRHEAEAVARLQHPHIVQIYEVGEQDGRPYFSLELIDGGSLDRRLNGRPLPPREAAQLVRTLAEAMQAAHQQGIIHRDLKPANILLTAAGQPKITDFGLAKKLDEADAQTRSGAILGTPSYAAPEQAAGKVRDIGPATDVYALGAILYETLVGRPPFKGETPLDTVLQVLSQEAVPPRGLITAIPRDLEIICLKCLEKHPVLRYPTAAALAEDLRRFLDGEAILARPAGTPELLWRWCRRNPLPATFLVVVTLLLIVVSLGSALGLWHLSRLSEELVRSTALESAAQQAEMLESLNTFYSAQVVERVKGHNIEVTHDYAGKKGAIPLPASLTIDLGNHISEHSERGMQVRLYSDYPFRSRKNGLPKDAFEWEALGRLRANPREPVYKFEDFQGKPSLRYATARVMKESCVACHNTHPESLKTNWKTGDVRGVVEIIRPLDRDVLRTRAGLRGSFALIGTVSALLLLVLTTAVVLLGLWSRRRLQATTPT
ncbi:MAG: protein kinase [Planctomycetia bacterium]|nr:protein kinase [Planctomycetia bacterium]